MLNNIITEDLGINKAIIDAGLIAETVKAMHKFKDHSQVHNRVFVSRHSSPCEIEKHADKMKRGWFNSYH